MFYAAKAAGVDIDYVTLLKSVTAGRDLVRAYAYTGLDPDNENQRNFHEIRRRVSAEAQHLDPDTLLLDGPDGWREIAVP